MLGKFSLPSVPLAQQAFPFIPDAHRQSMAMRHEEELTRTKSTEERARAKRLAEFQQKIASEFVLFTPPRHKVTVELLDEPLLSEAGQFALELFKQPASDTVQRTEVDELTYIAQQEKEEILEWFVHQDHPERIAALAEYVLNNALESLASNGNAEEKQRNLEWIFASEIYGTKTVQTAGGERKRLVYSSQVPMTFAWCCAQCGLHHENIREQLIGRLRQAAAQMRRREELGEVMPGRSKALVEAVAYAESL